MTFLEIYLIGGLVTLGLMTLLMRVSGVTLLEKTLATTEPGYKEYVESTSAFVPWFPRRRHGGEEQGQ
jgi:steroid 5-alpha reductase family enzyme